MAAATPDWRDARILDLREALPVSELRHLLVRAIAGANTPKEAADRIGVAIKDKIKTGAHQLLVTALIASLMRQHMQEAP